jgi:SPP1 family predicted phage head-tail adaptor
MTGGGKNTASRLRHRLILQQEIKAADGAGGCTRSWQNVADLWAEISPLKYRAGIGSERLVAGQIQSEISYKVTLRYRAVISTSMRLLFGNRAFNIRSVRNLNEDKEILELLVDEGVAN